MANPNLLAATTASGTTTYYTPGVATAVVLVPNAASSGQVFKVEQLVVSNLTSSAATATVQLYTNGAVAQGSAPSGGTAYSIAYQISVPANATLIVLDKTTALYLMEGTSITVTSGTASALTYSMSYEVIS